MRVEEFVWLWELPLDWDGNTNGGWFRVEICFCLLVEEDGDNSESLII